MSMVKVNDINMYYEIHGEGEPLILISGNGAESSQWKDMIPAFSKGYKWSHLITAVQGVLIGHI